MPYYHRQQCEHSWFARVRPPLSSDSQGYIRIHESKHVILTRKVSSGPVFAW